MKDVSAARGDAPTQEQLVAERDRLVEEPMTKETLVALFDTAYQSEEARSEAAPWEIDQPQPVVVALGKDGLIRGAVLDAGCGTGENTIHLVRLGHDVLGVDASTHAIDQARAKAAKAGVPARFEVADALNLGEEPKYDTIVDSALLHIFENEERAAYVRSLHRVCRQGALVHVLGLSDEGPDFGAPVISRAAIVEAFGGEGWEIEEVRQSEYRVVVDENGGLDELPAWLARVRRV
jgi:SAM-dependent methyltransferase